MTNSQHGHPDPKRRQRSPQPGESPIHCCHLCSCVELAHRRGIAGRQVGIIGIAAYIVREAPGARALGAGGQPRHHADVGHVGKREGALGRLAVDHLDARRYAHFRKVDAFERRQQLVVLDVDLRRCLQRGADLLVGTLDLERARHHAAHALDLLPIGGQRLVAPCPRQGREGLQVHRAVLGRITRLPDLLGGEAKQRRQPQRGAAEDLLDRLQRGPALGAGERLAVERVLADVEVERGQVRVHEVRQHRHHALVVVLGVGPAHDFVDLGQPMQHQLLEFGHGGDGHLLPAFMVGKRAQHPAHGVADLAVGLDEGLEDLRPDPEIVRSSRRPPPTAAGCRRPNP